MAACGTASTSDLCAHVRAAAQRSAALLRSRPFRDRSACTTGWRPKRLPESLRSMRARARCSVLGAATHRSPIPRAAAAIPNRRRRLGAASPIPYLGGVVCTSCADSPNFRWERTLGFDAIAARFSAASPGPARVDDLRITARDASGRARGFELVTDLGSTTVGGSAFRRGVGTRVLPSLLLTDLRRTPDGSGIAIAGGGLGHGVGLCQWGARGMALGGADEAAIVALVLPGHGSSTSRLNRRPANRSGSSTTRCRKSSSRSTPQASATEAASWLSMATSSGIARFYDLPRAARFERPIGAQRNARHPRRGCSATASAAAAPNCSCSIRRTRCSTIRKPRAGSR